jgi:hypothetical protein
MKVGDVGECIYARVDLWNPSIELRDVIHKLP